MNAERLSGVANLEDACTFLSGVFTELPAEEMVQAVLNAQMSFDAENTAAEAGDAAESELAAWADGARRIPAEEAVLQIARDRVVLMRGIYEDRILPPYESMWNVGGSANIGEVTRFYTEAGFAPTGQVHDAPDQLGLELAFVAALLGQEREALSRGETEAADECAAIRVRFAREHVETWAPAYAQEMRAQARTGFYRAVACMVSDVVYRLGTFE